MGKLSDKQKIEAVEKYSLGNYTCKQLALEYGVNPSSISKMLNRRGVELNHDFASYGRKYTFDETYFDRIDTEGKAYFLGLLYADGYNDEKRYSVSITLQEGDKDILEKFKLELKTNSPLLFLERNKKNKNWKNQFRLRLSSRKFSNQLAKLGCFQAKTLILKFPNQKQVPKHLLRHFLRGYFDGDGCIFTGKYQGNRKTYCWSILSTKSFCEAAKNTIYKNIEINCSIGLSKRKTNNITTTVYIQGKKTKTLLDWLYKDAIIYLKRKYDKYKQLCNDFML